MTGKFCPFSGLQVISKPDWDLSSENSTFSAEFSIIGSNILYSQTQGKADLEGIKKSISLNFKIAETTFGKSGLYVQIEDYAQLKGSTQSVRNYFLNKMDNNKNIIALIFCNLSSPNSIAVKIGSRLKKSSKTIQIAADYSEALKLAIEICIKNNLVQRTYGTDSFLQIVNSTKSLKPMEILQNKELDIKSLNFFNRSVVIDSTILHSQTIGFLNSEDILKIDKMRQSYQNELPDSFTIKYIIVDSSKLEGGSRKARRNYIKSLQIWHKQYPIHMYIFYSTNMFMKTAVKLARPLLPFKVKVAEDMKQGFEFIRKDRLSDSKIESYNKNGNRRKNWYREDIDKLFTFLSSIDWEDKGEIESIEIQESSPFFYLYQSIKLIKEEFDCLFEERKIKEKELSIALAENQNLLHELQHRVKNSFLLISSIISLMSNSHSSKQEQALLFEINGKINAIANMYNILYSSKKLSSTVLGEYLSSLIESFRDATGSISFYTDFDHVIIETNLITPMGLIISELITNSIKHAFKDTIKGRISLSLKKNKLGIVLEYSDNGCGCLEINEDKFSESFGISLIRSLAKQVSADLKFVNIEGLKCILVIQQSYFIPNNDK
jgi:two-component sensor histidine kinase